MGDVRWRLAPRWWLSLTSLTLLTISVSVAGAQVGLRVDLHEDQFLRFTNLTAEPLEVYRFNIFSSSGLLVPIPPGDHRAPAAPFTAVTRNTSAHIRYANLGRNYRLEPGASWTTQVAYPWDEAVARGDELSVQYERLGGNLNVQGACGLTAQACPEPEAVGWGFLALFALRRRRNPTASSDPASRVVQDGSGMGSAPAGAG